VSTDYDTKARVLLKHLRGREEKPELKSSTVENEIKKNYNIKKFNYNVKDETKTANLHFLESLVPYT